MDRKLDAAQEAKLNQYVEALIRDGDKFGLTSLRDPLVIRQMLIEDSLSGVDLLEGQKILDLGTGGGCPGIPLAIACPEQQFFLLEANGRKMGFLKAVVEELALENVELLHGRSEDIANQAQYRAQFDTVVSKAVAAMPALIELCLPFLKMHGQLLAYKGPQLGSELEQSKRAMHELKCKLDSITHYTNGERTLSLCKLRKIAPSPKAYPRRSGIPASQPLL